MIKTDFSNLRNKGVTITSLTIYVIVATIIIGVLLFLNVQFFSNMGELTKEANIDGNKIEFKSAFISDLKGSANVLEYSNNRIKLGNNVVWEVRALSDAKTDREAYAIFRNDVKIADYIIKNPVVAANQSYKFFDYDAIGNFVKTDWVYSDGNKFDYEYSSYLVGTTTKYIFVEDAVDPSVLPTMMPLTTPPPSTTTSPTPTPTPSGTPAPTIPPVPLSSSVSIDAVYSTRKVQPGEEVEFVITFAESGDGVVQYPYTVSFEMRAVGPGGTAILSGDPLTIAGVTMDDNGVYRMTWTINSAAELEDPQKNPKIFSVLISRTLPAGSLVITNTTDSDKTFEIPIEQNVKIQQPTRKNIVLLLDTSGSMAFCIKHTKDSDPDREIQKYFVPTKNAQYYGTLYPYDSDRDMICKKCGREHVVNLSNVICTEHPNATIVHDRRNGYDYCTKCAEKVKKVSTFWGTTYSCSEHNGNTSGWNAVYRIYQDSSTGTHYCTDCIEENIRSKRCAIHDYEYMTDDDYCMKCAKEYPSRINALKEAARVFAKSIIDGMGISENITMTMIQFNSYITVGSTLKNPTYEQVETEINKLRAVAGTFVREGLRNVNQTFKDRSRMLSDATNIMVFLSDGIASENHEIDVSTLNDFLRLGTEAFAVGFGDDYGTDEMNKIVERNEARIFDSQDEDSLIESFSNIAYIINAMQTTGGFLDAIVDTEHMYPVVLTGTTWDDLDYVVELGVASNETELDNMYITIDESGHVLIDFSKYANYTNFVVTFGQE